LQGKVFSAFLRKCQLIDLFFCFFDEEMKNFFGALDLYEEPFIIIITARCAWYSVMKKLRSKFIYIFESLGTIFANYL